MNKYRLGGNISPLDQQPVYREEGEINRSRHTGVYMNNTGKMHGSLPAGAVTRVNTLSDK